MEVESSDSSTSGSSGNGFINNDEDDDSFLANPPPLLNMSGYDSDDDDDDDFLLNNNDDDFCIGGGNEGVYSDVLDTSMEEHDTGLVPIFDIKAHEAGGRDIADLAYLSTLSNARKERWQHERLVWENHLELVFHEDTFSNEYRMSYAAFNVLKQILQPILQRNANKCRDSEPIMTEHIMAMGLRYLAGGRVLDNRRYIGMNKSSAYSAVDDFINAVNTCPELDIKFPSSAAEWEEVRQGWQARSSVPNIFHGNVAAADGFFQPTTKPTEKEVGNVMAYYSGHYESNGVNCQGLIKSDLQYMYFGVVAPGATNDNVAYSRAGNLKEIVDSLPLGLYIVTDAAYMLSENLLVPFTGKDRDDPYHDSFNYHLSQLRIRVEMAFGYMVNKFRILRRKLECSLKKNTAILMACARLHNFIIQQDKPFGASKYEARDEGNDDNSSDGEEEQLEIIPHPNAPLGMSYMPQLPDDSFDPYQGVSHTREGIVNALREGSIKRPLHNIQRKKEEMEHKSMSGHIIPREYISPI
ncbi:hypothetical protein ACHAWC_008001 [Mediolabrus comicus]